MGVGSWVSNAVIPGVENRGGRRGGKGGEGEGDERPPKGS